MNGNVIRTITIRGTSEGLDKVTADVNKLAAAQENVAVVSEQSAKRVLSLDAAWQKQTMRLDEAARAQANIARETKLADAALREGLATQQQHAQRLEQINQRYNTASQATQKFGQQTGLARHELINLGRQAQDVAVSLGSGQSFGTVLLQQGSQIADVFVSSGKSVGSFFSQAISWGARFVVSAGGVATAVAGIGAAALYMASSFASAQREIDKVLAGAGGAASGASRSGINRIAEGTAGGGMSIADAREAALTFAATGKIYEENIRSATSLTRDFALAMGIDTADAAKKLATALVDPSKGALDLNNSIRFLDVTTLEHIRTLQIHGDLQGAQKALMDAAAAAAKRQADQVAGLASAWQRATAAVSDFMERRKKEIGGPSIEDQLTGARQTQQTTQGALGRGQELGLGPRSIKALEDAARAATTEVQRLEKSLADAAKATADERFLKLSEEARDFTRSIIPQIARVEELTNAIAKMKEAQAARAERGMAPDQDLNTALQAAQARLALAKDLTAHAQQQLTIAQAVGQMAQIEAQHKVRILELTARLGPAEAARVASAERAVQLAQIEAQHKQTMVGLQGQLDVASQVTGIGQINAQYEATVALLTLQVGQAKAVEQAEMQRAISIAQANTSADQMLKSLKEENELIRAGTDEEKNRIKARQTYNDLINKGVDSSKASAVANQQYRNAEQRDGEAAAAREMDARAAQRERNKLMQRAVDHAQSEAWAMERVALAARNAAKEIMAFVPFGLSDSGMTPYVQGKNIFDSNQGGKSQFNPAGYVSSRVEQTTLNQAAIDNANRIFGSGGFTQDMNKYGFVSFRPNEGGLTNATRVGLDTTVGSSLTGGVGYGGIIDQLLGPGSGLASTNAGSVQATAQMLSRITNLLPEDQQAGSLQKQIDLLQRQPATLARDELIKQLTDQLKQLTDASKENTDALKTQADPLFSQGHDYLNQLRIGYYKAATGLSGIVQGSGGTDSTPVHMMLTPGEHVQVTPPGMSPTTVANDNSKNVTQNITINIESGPTPTERFTARQRAQGFIAAAARAAG